MKRTAIPLFCAFLLFTSAGVSQNSKQLRRVIEPVSDSKLTTLRGNTHPLARDEYDQGRVSDDLRAQRMMLVLERSAEQENALRKLLRDQQTPSSPDYRKWLSPDEFGLQFGISNEDLHVVTDWLISRGFQIERVSRGRGSVEFSGTAGQIARALHTEIHKYLVDGEEHFANASDPEIPAALTPVIGGVVSLHNFPRKRMSQDGGIFRKSNETGEVRPLFTVTPQSGKTFYLLAPSDFATIYNVQPLWDTGIDGSGQSIAIVAESNINISDIRSFRNLFGLPAIDPQIVINGADPGIVPGDESETVLDTEWSGAVARNATIKVVVSRSTETTPGIDLSAQYIVDNNVAPILSESYGACESNLGTSGNAFYNNLWEQAAAEGITVLVASGDFGSATCSAPNTFTGSDLSVSGAASTPFNVAVGGTDFDQTGNPTLYWNPSNNSLQASAKGYIPELTWNDSCAQSGSCATTTPETFNHIAGGGGPSSIYSKPAWQSGPGVPNDGKRDLPDLSMFAGDGRNLSFYLVCQADQVKNVPCDLNAPYTDFTSGAGTSASVQVFGGIMALVNQYQTAHGFSARQGNANYVFYKLAAQNPSNCNSSSNPGSGSSCVFYDITKGNNSVICQSAGFQNCSLSTRLLVDPADMSTPAWTAGPGYDRATGLGSVNAQNLVTRWSSASFSATATSLSLSPATAITHGQPLTLSVSVSALSGSGTPSGDVSLMSNAQAFGKFTLANGAINSQTVSSLPGGTYGVTGHYAGDGVFAASDSNAVNVQVNPEPSKTIVRLVTFAQANVSNNNALSAVYGSPYILRMDVANASGSVSHLCAQIASITCPTGGITLTDNGNPLDAGVYKLNNEGTAEDFAIQLAGGQHSVQAQYSGDNSYQPNTGTAMLTISLATTNIGMGIPGNLIVGAPFDVTVNLSTQSSGAAPSGQLTFSVDGSPISGNVSVTAKAGSGNATALLMGKLTGLTFNTSGPHTLTVTYSGDQNYATSSSSTTLFPRYTLPAPSLSATPAAVQYGSSTTATLVVTTGQKNQPAPAGNVTFLLSREGRQAIATLTPATDSNGNVAAQASVSFQPVFDDRIDALYSGDQNYVGLTGAVSTNVTVVGAPDFSVSANPATLTVTRGQSGAATITFTQLNGYTQGAALACSLPATMQEATCSLSPASVTPTSGTTATAIVTITTTAAHTATLRKRWNWLFGGGATTVACMLVIGMPGIRRSRNLLAMLLIFSFVAFTAASCGGGGGSVVATPPVTNTDPGTAAGTYTVTVNASAVINGFSSSHSANIAVMVQ